MGIRKIHVGRKPKDDNPIDKENTALFYLKQPRFQLGKKLCKKLRIGNWYYAMLEYDEDKHQFVYTKCANIPGSTKIHRQKDVAGCRFWITSVVKELNMSERWHVNKTKDVLVFTPAGGKIIKATRICNKFF